jgi:hypothetical protein
MRPAPKQERANMAAMVLVGLVGAVPPAVMAAKVIARLLGF